MDVLMTDARAKVLDDLANGRFERLGDAVSAARAALAANSQEAWVAALLNAPNPAVTPAVGGEAMREALARRILEAWRIRFPNNAYAWPGAPNEFASAAAKVCAAALAAPPASPLRGRAYIIEECAKACEARIRGTDGLPGGNEYGHYAPYNCEDLACAKAVRALAAPPEQPAAAPTRRETIIEEIAQKTFALMGQDKATRHEVQRFIRSLSSNVSDKTTLTGEPS